MASRFAYRAVAVRDLLSFRKAYIDRNPDVVCLDVQLFRGDCSEALDFLIETGCEIPVILLTGYTTGFMDVLANTYRGQGLDIEAKLNKQRDLRKFESMLEAKALANAQPTGQVVQTVDI